jgi:hypothetical protein
VRPGFEILTDCSRDALGRAGRRAANGPSPFVR